MKTSEYSQSKDQLGDFSQTLIDCIYQHLGLAIVKKKNTVCSKAESLLSIPIFLGILI